MKITIESTSRVVEASGIKCRVWEGVSEGGVKVSCLIPRIAADAEQDLAQFEAELQEHAAPSAIVAFPLRMVL